LALVLVLTFLAVPGPGLARNVLDSANTSDQRIGIRLLDAPISRHDDPRAQVYVVDFLAPGTTIKRRVLITNGSSTMQHVAVFPGAASIDNNMFDAMSGIATNELTSWTSVDRSTVDIPAGRSTEVLVTIAVPRVASVGERFGVIWAQTTAATNTGSQIMMVSRVGVRIYLDVGTGGEPPSSFEITSLAAARTKDGQPEVLATVRNTGGRTLDMAGQLSLSDGPGGLSAGPFPATVGTTLLPGRTGKVEVLFDKRLPAGPWKVRLKLVSGAIERTVVATLTFPRAANSTSETVTLETSGGVDSGLLIGVGVALVAALAWVFTARRSRARRTG
jgi:hypothetical protein